MTLNDLQAICARRSLEFELEPWTPSQWLQALVGELGEYANVRKKFERGDISSGEFLLSAEDELADIQIYLCLLATQLEIDLENATILKFNADSHKRGFKTFIGDPS